MRGKYTTLFHKMTYLVQLWENPLIGLAFLDSDGTYADANLTYCRILNVTRPALIGHKWQEFTSEDDHAECEYLIEGVKTGKLHDYQLRKKYKIKDDHYVDVIVGIKAIVDDDGNFVCLYKTCIPIELLIDKSDLIVQYRPGPLQTPESKLDTRLNIVYRLIGVIIGGGTILAAIVTGLYWLFRGVEVILTHLGGKS